MREGKNGTYIDETISICTDSHQLHRKGQYSSPSHKKKAINDEPMAPWKHSVILQLKVNSLINPFFVGGMG